MKSPFAWNPPMSRLERVSILAGAALFWFVLSLYDQPNDEYIFQQMVQNFRQLPELFTSTAHAFWEYFQTGDWPAVAAILDEAANKGIMCVTDVLMISWLAWQWVRPGWRSYLWDALGAASLAMLGYYVYEAGAAGDIIYDFILVTYLVVLAFAVLGALCFGHFGRLLFHSREVKPAAPAASGEETP